MAGPNGEAGPVPSSNESVSSIEQIVSGTSGFQQGLSWLKSNAKPIGSVTDLGSVQGYYWFQNNNQGNCNTSPVPAAALSTGNVQCQNCSLSTVNCANCDSRSYLQSACNCACTYNCTTNTDQSYNCDCNCNCNCLVCQCACW